MVSNVTHKGRRHAVWVGRLGPPMEVLLFLQEGGLHSQGKTEDPKGSLINCYHYFVSGVPRGASCPSRAVLYTSAFNNVFDSTALRRTISLSCKISARVAIFSAVEGKGTEEGMTLFVSTAAFSSQKAFSASVLFPVGGEKRSFLSKLCPFCPSLQGLLFSQVGISAWSPHSAPEIRL